VKGGHGSQGPDEGAPEENFREKVWNDRAEAGQMVNHICWYNPAIPVIKIETHIAGYQRLTPVILIT
jgi:hypothetical protein